MPATASVEPPAIGPYRLPNRVILAPMAGVTDRPFRQLCRRLGAGLVVSEMVTADPSLWHTRKSRQRLDHRGEPGPRSVQIAGGDARMLAEAARLNAERGAQIIDINMGCPAKKVCNKAAGSALLRDERLVAEILEAVVAAVDVPVTLKIRTGWCDRTRNGERVARLAEEAGIRALAVHGRTREQRYGGRAEYDTIAAIKAAVGIPVFANGDVDSPHKAAEVLDYTGADAVMVGRGAQGNPWIFRQIDHFLRTGETLAMPCSAEQRAVMGGHLDALHGFYGDVMGVRIARKHIGWYLGDRDDAKALRKRFNVLETPDAQKRFVDELFRQAPEPATDGISAA
ncbi:MULTISPECIES: tRNA dihydrouridine synthase DusB [Modicisalibacter]|uniref:tRNA dihydrouridine synthase DusB n=1 Tax=Modicisalibacter TaxID=574347 RepID=UPI00100B1F65|nr:MULTISPECIES: tRNA dihydrouridine synthase DusB [Halomonadaceae]MBZ9560319.1 tRNA dihydrouridine synthase DusB [Modicisalibacter sp. R2A 31.J]MBZ9576228.1 tRNA dihydrouridine synthase DusB [Modicisalibacter sp. MOD 31.J]